MDHLAASARFDNAANYGNQIGLNQGSVINNVYHTQSDGQQPGTPWVSGNVHWTISRPVNNFFTGRVAILRQVEDLIRVALANESPSEPCRIVLTGMGGQGKSEICLRVANNLRDLFWGVFWVDVSYFGQAETAFIAVAKQLQKPASTIREVLQTLANTKYPWLLVLDNADDPGYDYQDYLPPGHHGIVLMTSRNGECSQYATVHHEFLQGLDDEDGIQLLLKTAQIQPQQRLVLRDQAREVCHLLGSHPLALIQAGSYVAKKHCTLANYPQVYNRYRQRLLRFHPGQARSRYRDVYATFEASMDIIKTLRPEGDDAVHLLSMLSTLQWSPLPLSVFEACWQAARNALHREIGADARHQGLCKWHVEPLSRIIRADESEWDSYYLMNALQLLQNLALVSVPTSDDSITISMHPLAHAWSKDRLTPEEQDQAWVAAACLMAFVYPSKYCLTSDYELLRPHFISLFSRDVKSLFRTNPSNLLAEMLISCGLSLGEMRLDRELASLLADVFSELKLDPLRPRLDWIHLYTLHAANLNRLCSRSDLLTVAAQNLRIQEQILPARDPERLHSQRILVHAYKICGRYKAAIKLLTKIIEIQTEYKSLTDSTLLDDRLRLSALYAMVNRGGEAVLTAEAVYAMQDGCPQRSRGSQRSDKFVLAGAYLSNGQRQKAIDLLEDLAAVEARVLPELSPYRLQTLSLLGSAYRQNGQLHDAITILQETAKGLDDSVAYDHGARLTNLRHLAQAFWDDKQTDKAIEIFRNVTQAENSSMLDDHADRWWTNRQLASAYLESGSFQQSIDILEMIVFRGADNPNQDRGVEAEVLSLLAQAYTRNGQALKAVEILEKALVTEPEREGSEKRPWLKLQHDLSLMLWDAGQRQRALDVMANVVAKGNRVMGSDDPERQKLIQTLKRFFADMDELADRSNAVDAERGISAYVDIIPSHHRR